VPSAAKDFDSKFWEAAKYFWPKRFKDWLLAYFAEDGTRKVVTMCPKVRKLWEAGYFALKPLRASTDGTVLDLQFFWMKHLKEVKLWSLLDTPLPSWAEPAGLPRGALGCYTKNMLRSGDVIHLETQDPKKDALPSYELFEFRWHLDMFEAMKDSITCLMPRGLSLERDMSDESLDQSNELVRIDLPPSLFK
jgi:hypothetical protein